MLPLIDLGILCSTSTYTTMSPNWRDVLQGVLFERLDDWRESVNLDDSNADGAKNTVVLGIIATELNTLAGAMKGKWLDADRLPHGYAVASRPATSVAHEIQHALGRPHASSGCVTDPRQAGEAWPPDNLGFLQGIGLVSTPGSGGGRGPYKIIARSGAPGGPGEVYDLMGYCAAETQTTISPKGWRTS